MTVAARVAAWTIPKCPRGGVSIPTQLYPTVMPSSTIVDNQAPNGSAVAGLVGGAHLVNNVAAGPQGTSVAWCSAGVAAAVSFSHNDVYSGGPSPTPAVPTQRAATATSR